MEVPNELSTCVCFLCTNEKGTYVARCTAFFASVPADIGVAEGGHIYLITAKHCIEGAQRYGNTLFARLNMENGPVRYAEIKQAWTYNDEDGSDVAAIQFDPPSNAEFRCIPIGMMATDQVLREKRVGAGDEVVVTGLFTKRKGEARNIPILRAGMISVMPGEPLVDDGGHEYLAYLIELRSTGGLSGSPVFVVNSRFADPTNRTPNLGLQLFSYVFLLLGIIRGHWEHKNSVTDIAEDMQNGSEPFNLGIAIATPSQECVKLLNREEFVKKRREADLLWRKENAPKEQTQ